MKYIILTSLLFITSAFSAETKIEPVYGFQRNFHVEPKPSRYRTEIFLGVRGTYGTEIIAAEAELTQSNSSDSIGDVNVKYSTQSLMAGLRLTPITTEYYNIYMRGGMRMQKKTTEITQNGVTTSNTDGPNLDPYAGAGIGMSVGGVFSLNAGATLVYNRNAEPGEQYDTRYTLGAGISFGNR